MVKRCQNSIKIGKHSPFGQRSPMEFEGFFPKNLAGWPTVELEAVFKKNWAGLRICSP